MTEALLLNQLEQYLPADLLAQVKNALTEQYWTDSQLEQFGFCVNHTGKMTGLISYSTSNLTNTFCQAHKNVDGSICQHCFADSQLKRYSTLARKLAKNSKRIAEIIPDEQLPIINHRQYSLVRFESFGDLFCENQLINYFNIANKNPQINFALWTKNPFIVYAVLKTHNKPSNLQIVFSSLYLNKPQEAPGWADKVFTVYDNQTIEQQHVNINCGGNSCMACQKCYHHSANKIINEKLK